MRLKADLQVCNRSMSNQGLRNNNRHALFTLGRKPEDEKDINSDQNSSPNIYLMVNTAKDNKAGTSYRVTNFHRNRTNQQNSLNVEVFGRFTKEGRATLRFSEPAHDLSINNADPVYLKAFIHVLKNSHNLPINAKQFSTLNPVFKRQIQKEASKLTIQERKDYPSNEAGFPHTLKELKIHKLQLKKIDIRIFRLNLLVTLDLSGNVIRSIPHELHTMVSLKDLNLANNKIANISPTFCQNTNFCNQLLQLNLEGNGLQQIPNNLTNFTNLMVLNMKNNLFSYLPRGLFQKMTKLRSLDISDCRYLISLPTTFFDTTRLDSVNASKLPKIFSRIDYRNYTSGCHEDGVLDTTANVPRLLDVTSRKILETENLYKFVLIMEGVIPSILKEYLKTLVRCYCHKTCFPSSCLVKVLRFRIDDVMKMVTRDLITDVPNGTANFECIFCSKGCKERFIKSLNLLPS